MLKTFIFAILFMLVKPVYPADIVAYDRFVHMTPIEQQKVVVTIMELIVELEERYKHEVKKSGFNLERFQEHKEKLRKISAFLFFPEAHAVSHDYGHHLTNMQILLESTDACLYGGWISTMNGNVCTHPELSSDRTKHLYDKSLGCIAPGKISCNPAIFGYQHVARKTLFCVAGNTDSANTSRACMQKALNDESNFSTSTREERLRHIAESISSPAYREMGKELFGFLVKTCACNQGSPVIAARYQNAIFPHRTCLSLLRMISESDALCSTEGQPLNEGQRNLLNLLKQATESIINENDVDAHYSNILNEFKEKPEYQAVCSSCPPGEKIMLLDNQCKKICPNPDHVRPRREDPDSKCVALCEDGTLPPEGGACPTDVI